MQGIIQEIEKDKGRKKKRDRQKGGKKAREMDGENSRNNTRDRER